MPELPEVETVRRDLEASVVGRRIVAAAATGARTVRRQGARVVVERSVGARIDAAQRHGKYLLLPLDTGATMLVHLRMSGQLLLAASADDERAKHTHVVLALDDGRQLRFVDPRTFGEVVVASPLEVDAPELARLGPDPLVHEPPVRRLAEALAGRRAPVKALLMDQRVLAGIGNIYSDEVLFQAGVRPERPGGSLSQAAVGRVHDAVGSVLREAVEARGSSLADAQYVDLHGRAGGYQRSHRVYARAGEPCVRCGSPVVRTRFGARSSFSCRRCQR